MSWKVVACLFFLSGASLGTPPGGTENFYNYRADYDDDLGEYNSNGFDRKIGRDNYEYDESDSKYRGSDDWVGGNRRGWTTPPSASFSFNRINPKRPHNTFQKPVTTGWDEEETTHPWSPPPPRRKPSYVVKIRRPVKKDPAWIYFRPPSPGRPAPGWKKPRHPISPPSRRPRPDKVNSWEEESNGNVGSYPTDASYSFAFDAGDHERSEYSDPWGTVRGSYSYVDPTGVRRTVHYTAGADTGFKVLKSQPSNLNENVYSDPVIVKRKPSAFVYHLHPDGGWKPWEGSKDGGPIKIKGRQEDPEEELALDETRYEPPLRKEGPSEEPQLQPRETSPSPPSDLDEDKISIHGYDGGYGDRNPLVVLEDKRISPGKMMTLRMRRKKEDQPRRHKKSSKIQNSSSHSTTLADKPII